MQFLYILCHKVSGKLDPALRRLQECISQKPHLNLHEKGFVIHASLCNLTTQPIMKTQWIGSLLKKSSPTCITLNELVKRHHDI